MLIYYKIKIIDEVIRIIRSSYDDAKERLMERFELDDIQAQDHCCEYMTGGRVVVLGPTGRNFAAGMSGGLAYVWDPHHNFDYYCNMEMIELGLIEEKARMEELKGLIAEHRRLTGSVLAARMLEH